MFKTVLSSATEDSHNVFDLFWFYVYLAMDNKKLSHNCLDSALFIAYKGKLTDYII